MLKDRKFSTAATTIPQLLIRFHNKALVVAGVPTQKNEL